MGSIPIIGSNNLRGLIEKSIKLNKLKNNN
jgi:hypothetical protein